MDQITSPTAPASAPCILGFNSILPRQTRPKCGMDLLPEGTRFGLLRHMISSPVHVAVMVALMIAVMMAAMMMH